MQPQDDLNCYLFPSVKGPMGTDGGTGTKGPVVCAVIVFENVFVC